MSKVKLSTLSMDDQVMVGGEVMEVSELINDLDEYRSKRICTVQPHRAAIDAKDVIDDVIENIHCNGMYDGWDNNVKQDITEEDISKIQVIFDGIFARSPSQNTAYYEDKQILVDL